MKTTSILDIKSCLQKKQKSLSDKLVEKEFLLCLFNIDFIIKSFEYLGIKWVGSIDLFHDTGPLHQMHGVLKEKKIKN